MRGCLPISLGRKLRLREETYPVMQLGKGRIWIQIQGWEPMHLTTILSHPAQGAEFKRSRFLG